uniref:Oxidoreductase molybdopterin-binding domain-containing protein n=1 Tax=Acidicaldus sp. TaxID=1872105 RepID=A0A8J4H9A9_9PROT
MRRVTRRLRGVVPALALLLLGFAARADMAPHAAAAPPSAIIIIGDGGKTVSLGAEDFAKLARVRVEVSFATEHGPRHAVFEGPLLWTLLGESGVIDLAKPRGTVGRVVIVTGWDGYRVALALGEIAPQFEGKQVIVAERKDGQALEAGHFRLVVPGDKMGGRSLRDVARITVNEGQESPP